MQTYLLTKKEIISEANKRQFFLRVIRPVMGSNKPDEKYLPARLSGSSLDFPVVQASDGHYAEITWNMAERIMKGEIKNVY